MKKLGKLQINNERIIKNEELKTFKGGSIDGCTYCLCNCFLIPEAWWGCYCSIEEMESAIAVHCGSYGDGGCSCSDYLC